MPRRHRPPGGTLEYAVLAALWELGSATAREVHVRVGEADGLVYTTTAKVLDRLNAKRLVIRKRVGRLFVYRPAVARDVIDQERTTTALSALLGSEPIPAIATLVDTVEAIDPDLLDELARVVRRRRARRGT
jgi:predicted transcriptional regulator